MTRLPRIPPADLVRALKRGGWFEVGQEGSHIQLKHPTRRGKVTVGIHSGKIVPARNLASILKQAGLTPDELRKLL